MRSKRIYLDNNSTTSLSPEVLDAMLPYFTGEARNPSSSHREGRLARRALDTARESIAELLGAEFDEIVFTSGGTEANNLAIFGQALRVPGPLITSTIEHPSVSGCFDELACWGFEVHRLNVDASGVVRVADFPALLASQPSLVSVMLANNETGSIQPIKELADEARAHGVYIHSDAVQSVGKLPVSYRALGVNSISLSAHKFHGPVGIGALVIDKLHKPRPILHGGHQEFGLRPGTEPVALVVGMAKALELALRDLDHAISLMSELRDLLWNLLRERVERATLNGPVEQRLCNTVNVHFPGLDAQSAVLALDLAGLACSTGSACSSGAPTPSPVLLAMGLSEQQARGSIRFSLSRQTTPEQIRDAVELIEQAVSQQRASGPPASAEANWRGRQLP